MSLIKAESHSFLNQELCKKIGNEKVELTKNQYDFVKTIEKDERGFSSNFLPASKKKRNKKPPLNVKKGKFPILHKIMKEGKVPSKYKSALYKIKNSERIQDVVKEQKGEKNTKGLQRKTYKNYVTGMQSPQHFSKEWSRNALNNYFKLIKSQRGEPNRPDKVGYIEDIALHSPSHRHKFSDLDLKSFKFKMDPKLLPKSQTMLNLQDFRKGLKSEGCFRLTKNFPNSKTNNTNNTQSTTITNNLANSSSTERAKINPTFLEQIQEIQKQQQMKQAQQAFQVKKTHKLRNGESLEQQFLRSDYRKKPQSRNQTNPLVFDIQSLFKQFQSNLCSKGDLSNAKHGPPIDSHDFSNQIQRCFTLPLDDKEHQSNNAKYPIFHKKYPHSSNDLAQTSHAFIKNLNKNVLSIDIPAPPSEGSSTNSDSFNSLSLSPKKKDVGRITMDFFHNTFNQNSYNNNKRVEEQENKQASLSFAKMKKKCSSTQTRNFGRNENCGLL
jgi:hypothetical protein